MKKILMLLLIPAMLLCGCHANSEKENAAEYYEKLSKVQEIAVLPADTSAETQILAESEEISDFIFALDMEHWKMKALPKEAESVGSFQLSQEETIKFGESTTDGALYPVCEMLCYGDIPYVTLEMAGMKMTFQVSDTTMEYLADYFR